ncbi:unnamed protein product [Auanema sp. JU1783]|nr:unnamed protein product [Auanema sp. JU1783]
MLKLLALNGFLLTLSLSSAISIHEPVMCDLFEEATSLHCAAPLVEYADLAYRTLHPPLSTIGDLCHQYEKYLICTAGVRSECRRSRAPNVERMYELMCEEKYLSIVREEKHCLVELESDELLKECFVNRTNILRDEEVIESIGDSTHPPVSYECSVIQAYVDCLLERDTNECSDAVKVEVSLLSLMAIRDGSECQLITDGSRSRPKAEPQEVCDKHGLCVCRSQGYIYDASISKCVDINECDSPTNGCSQMCENLPGSYECTCDQKFYHLAQDNKTCNRNDADPLWLFFAHGQSIWNISSDGKTFQLQRAGLQKTAMLDIDVYEKRIYYADIGANAIERMNMEGTFPQVIQRMEVDGVEGIAVDWMGRNLYSLRRNDILVQTLDGRYRRAVYSNVMKLPRAIALHPQMGKMFVSDWSSSAFIAVANMDGTSFKKIITERVTWPNTLTVDIYADKFYWADAFLDVIEVANLDGSGRRVIISDSGSVPHVFGMAVADDHLYWTDWTYRGLLRADKLTGDNITVLAQTALLPYSLKVFHQSVQPAEPTSCGTKGCTQLCLLGPNEAATCACGEGFELTDDGKTCISNCSSSQIECGGTDPKCISKLYLCDGIAHCANHADETRCPARFCLPGRFQCHDNKSCAPPGGLCNGVHDCADSSDEIYCEQKVHLIHASL